MDPQALLTRINLNTVDLLGVPGGRPELTRQDIMAALGMGSLPETYFKLAMMLYADDKTYEADVERAVGKMAVDMSSEMRWPGTERGKEQLLSVAKVALMELLTEHERVCKHCNGDGLRPAGSKMPAPEGLDPATCPKCRGWGRYHLSENEKADRAGIPKSTWRGAGWEERYRLIHQAIADWVLDVHRHLRRHIGSDAAPATPQGTERRAEQPVTLGYRLAFGRITTYPVVHTEGDNVAYQLSTGNIRVETLTGQNHQWFDTFEKAQRHLINRLHGEVDDIRRRLDAKQKELADARALNPKMPAKEIP